MNRHDRFQPGAIVRTGRPHIDDEIQHILALAGLLGEGAVAIDAGANIGLIAIPLAQQLAASNGVVIAFEPQRLIYYMLAGNTAHAGLENLYCHQMALGAEPGSIVVPQLDPHGDADFGQVPLGEGDRPGDPVRLATIAAHRPVIWIEIWPNQYANVHPWLQARGYDLAVVDRLNFIAVPNEKADSFPHTFRSFDGTTNPFF